MLAQSDTKFRRASERAGRALTSLLSGISGSAYSGCGTLELAALACIWSADMIMHVLDGESNDQVDAGFERDETDSGKKQMVRGEVRSPMICVWCGHPCQFNAYLNSGSLVYVNCV